MLCVESSKKDRNCTVPSRGVRLNDVFIFCRIIYNFYFLFNYFNYFNLFFKDGVEFQCTQCLCSPGSQVSLSLSLSLSPHPSSISFCYYHSEDYKNALDHIHYGLRLDSPNIEMLVLKALILHTTIDQWRSFDIDVKQIKESWKEEVDYPPPLTEWNDPFASYCDTFPSVAGSCLLRAKEICLFHLESVRDSDPMTSSLRGLLGSPLSLSFSLSFSFSSLFSLSLSLPLSLSLFLSFLPSLSPLFLFPSFFLFLSLSSLSLSLLSVDRRYITASIGKIFLDVQLDGLCCSIAEKLFSLEREEGERVKREREGSERGGSEREEGEREGLGKSESERERQRGRDIYDELTRHRHPQLGSYSDFLDGYSQTKEPSEMETFFALLLWNNLAVLSSRHLLCDAAEYCFKKVCLRRSVY